MDLLESVKDKYFPGEGDQIVVDGETVFTLGFYYVVLFLILYAIDYYVDNPAIGNIQDTAFFFGLGIFGYLFYATGYSIVFLPITVFYLDKLYRDDKTPTSNKIFSAIVLAFGSVIAGFTLNYYKTAFLGSDTL